MHRRREADMRMLPSLSTSMSVPVSATMKFAPVMPASACKNFSRKIWRAKEVSSSPVSSGSSVLNMRLKRSVMRSRL